MNRRKALLVFIPLVVLACCAAGVAVGALAFSPLRERVMAVLGLRQQTLAADLIPADAILYVSLSQNLQAQPGYETIRQAYLDNPQVKRAFEDFKANLKRDTKIDWEADIAPWIGTEIGIAIMAISPENLQRDQVPVVFLIASRDLGASGRFLERIRSMSAEEGRPFEERVYRQTRYWFRPSDAGKREPSLFLAIVRDFVVIATHEKAIEAVVDRAAGQGEPLSAASRFQRVMRELPSQAVLLGYADYGSLFNLYRQMLTQTPGAPSLEELLGTGPSQQILQATEGVGFSGELLPEGIRFRFVTLIQREKLSPEAQAALDVPALSGHMLARVPEDAIVLFQTPIGQATRQTLDALRANPDMRRQLQDMEAALGIDLEEDLLAWMTGDMALIVQPVRAKISPGSPVGVSVLIETDRPEAARTGLGRLERVLQMAGLTVEEGEVEGRPLRVLVDPRGQRVAAYAVGPGVVGIGIPPEALEKSHPERPPQRTIEGNPRFQEVLRHLPERRSSLMLMDAQALWDLIGNLVPAGERKKFRQDVRPFLDPIRGIGAASEANPGSAVQQGVFFIRIVAPSP